MNPTLIYATPTNRKISNKQPKLTGLYIYTYKYVRQYGNGMLVIAARNPMRAMELVEQRLSPLVCPPDNLNQIVGALYDGVEGIKDCQEYLE